MKDLMGLMKKAQEMQAKMQEAQQRLADARVVGQAGAGLLTLTFDGEGGLVGARIDPSLVDPEEVEVLEDLIVAAGADAKRKLAAKREEIMREAAGGLELPPGFKMPF